MTSLIKFKSLLVLQQMLVGREPDSYVFYLLRRVLDPDLFRLNFAYQSYFFQNFHGSEYITDVFFRYSREESEKSSPFIIEVGFQLYFLLMRMSENFKIDEDENYTNRLLSLMTDQSKLKQSSDSEVLQVRRSL